MPEFGEVKVARELGLKSWDKRIWVACENCGCDDKRLLEINHKKGGGNKEILSGNQAMAFYRDIVMLRRGTDDLELLCRPCNSLHYLELKYGKLPMKVIWYGKSPPTP